MRRVLRRKAVTIIAAILSFTAIPAAGVVATATPALASVKICNTPTGSFCADAPTLGSGDPVVLTLNGRNFNEADQHFTCCNGHEVFRLEFSANTTLCMGVQDLGVNVTVRACSGGNSTNVNWARFPNSDGSVSWFSNPKNLWLSSDNTQGDQLFVAAMPCSACLNRWTG